MAFQTLDINMMNTNCFFRHNRWQRRWNHIGVGFEKCLQVKVKIIIHFMHFKSHTLICRNRNCVMGFNLVRWRTNNWLNQDPFLIIYFDRNRTSYHLKFVFKWWGQIIRFGWKGVAVLGAVFKAEKAVFQEEHYWSGDFGLFSFSCMLVTLHQLRWCFGTCVGGIPGNILLLASPYNSFAASFWGSFCRTRGYFHGYFLSSSWTIPYPNYLFISIDFDKICRKLEVKSCSAAFIWSWLLDLSIELFPDPYSSSLFLCRKDINYINEFQRRVTFDLEKKPAFASQNYILTPTLKCNTGKGTSDLFYFGIDLVLPVIYFMKLTVVVEIVPFTQRSKYYRYPPGIFLCKYDLKSYDTYLESWEGVKNERSYTHIPYHNNIETQTLEDDSSSDAGLLIFVLCRFTIHNVRNLSVSVILRTWRALSGDKRVNLYTYPHSNILETQIIEDASSFGAGSLTNFVLCRDFIMVSFEKCFYHYIRFQDTRLHNVYWNLVTITGLGTSFSSYNIQHGGIDQLKMLMQLYWMDSF